MLTKTDGLMRMSLRIGWHVFPNCQPAVHPRYFDLFLKAPASASLN